MGKFKEALYTNTEKFANKYGYIFTSLYLYEFNQQYNIHCDLPKECEQKSEDIIKLVLLNYFEDLLKESEINIELICPLMLFDLLELFDY
jgi:hypothetical protein